jgi:hypothetical protein
VKKIEPLSILSALLALSVFILNDAILGNIILILSAIIALLSYKRIKKNENEYEKIPIYVTLVIVWGTIIIRFFLISLFSILHIF